MIVATAGHVDHGKTYLVKNLTGVDTDRLAEEKRRGVSINLGFAYRNLDDNKVLGFIDVPGHTRFINTMIAGVSGIDLGLLIIAADDGVMPQTQEHLDVLRLLDVRQFVIVLTKIDSVDQDRVDFVANQAQRLFLEEIAVFRVSNKSLKGISDLQQYLDEAARTLSAQVSNGHFRLSIDRAFTIKGSGLVVTGTAISGKVKVGDSLLLQPQGKIIRVREIHAQNKKVEAGRSGQRCAINITGNVKLSEIHRGNSLVAESLDALSRRSDVSVRLLPNTPFSLKHLSPVRVHIGAGRSSARIFFLENILKLNSGQAVLAQLIFDEPVSVCSGDYFIIRDDSETTTLGGGCILDPAAPKKGKVKEGRLELLSTLSAVDDFALGPEIVLKHQVFEQGQIIRCIDFCRAWNIHTDEYSRLLEVVGSKHVRDLNGYLISQNKCDKTKAEMKNALSNFHRKFPQKEGMPPKDIRGIQIEAVFVSLLGELVKEGVAVLRGGLLSLKSHKVKVSSKALNQWAKVETVYDKQGKKFPRVAELMSETGFEKIELTDILKVAVKNGYLHKLSDNRYGRPSDLYEMAEQVILLSESVEEFKVVEFKSVISSGRGLAIELLEYFDKVKLTKRIGNQRVILDRTVLNKLSGA